MGLSGQDCHPVSCDTTFSRAARLFLNPLAGRQQEPDPVDGVEARDAVPDHMHTFSVAAPPVFIGAADLVRPECVT